MTDVMYESDFYREDNRVEAQDVVPAYSLYDAYTDND